MQKIIGLLLILSTLFLSCDKLLESNAKDSISEEEAVKSIERIYSILLGCYDELQSKEYYGRDFIIDAEVLADNCLITAENSNRFTYEAQNMEGAHFDCWRNCYAIIGQTNHILKNIDRVEGDVKYKKYIKAQTLFIRSLVYHDLLRVYSREPNHLIDGFDWGVPMIDEPFSGKISESIYVKRAKIDVNYLAIESYLKESINLFIESEYNEQPFYASSFSAKALLARVYLYQEQWQLAAEIADDVLREMSIAIEDEDYIKVFKEQSEAIFSLKYMNSENTVFESLQSIYLRIDDGERDGEGFGNDEGTGYGDVMVSADLYSRYEHNDKRLNLIRKVKKSEEKVLWNEKFNGYAGEYGLDYIQIIRLSEVLLIRAESYSNISGRETLALQDLNTLRNKRGLASLDLSGKELKKAILNERRIELAFEGHRFFDLKRKGLEVVKSDGRVLYYDNYKVVARIPIREKDINNNIIQNPGY